MKKIKVIISRAEDGFYSAHCKSEMFSGAGDTVVMAQKDLKEQMDFFRECAIQDGTKYPKFLDAEYEFEYSYDTSSILEFYSKILSLSGLEAVTGINQKQLWKYLHGMAKPRPAQIERIKKGLHDLGRELCSVTL